LGVKVPFLAFLSMSKPKYTPKSSPALLNRDAQCFLPDRLRSAAGRVRPAADLTIKLALVFVQKGIDLFGNIREQPSQCGGCFGRGLGGGCLPAQPMQASINGHEGSFNRI
jgi:hypothetical protein